MFVIKMPSIFSLKNNDWLGGGNIATKLLSQFLITESFWSHSVLPWKFMLKC